MVLNMPVVDMLVKGGKLVSPEGVFSASIAIDGGKIVGVGNDATLPTGNKVLNADGKYIFPGVIDPHTHPGGQRPFDLDIKTQTTVAPLGGVTTMIGICKSTKMSRTFREISIPEDVVSYTKIFPEAEDIIKQNASVDFAFTWAVQSDEHAAEIPLYAKEFGVTSYKFYIGYKKADKYTSNIGLPTDIDDGTIYLGFENIGKIGPPGIALIHAENMEINRIFAKREVDARKNDLTAWSDRSPNFSEAVHIKAYGYLAKTAQCPIYVVHLSTGEGLEEVMKARNEGVDITAETCPQYLIINNREDPPGIYGKVNPPIRDRTANERLWWGINAKWVTTIGTDHVPTTRQLKETRYAKTMGSIHMPIRAKEGALDVWTIGGAFTGSQTMLPSLLSYGFHTGKVTLERICNICCYNTAKVFGLQGKGSISVGADADLAIVDLKLSKKITPELFGVYCIFEGRELQGWPVATILRGEIIVDDGRFIGKSGYGQYLRRTVNDGSSSVL